MSSNAGITKNAGNSGTLTVENKQGSLNGVRFIITAKGAPATSLVTTNQTGKTYARAGNTYTELMAGDYTVGSGKKQASMQFQVKIVDASNTSSPAPVNSLASIAGDYTIHAKASGSAKVGLKATTAGGTDATTPVINFDRTGATACEGALAGTEDGSIDIMKINIDASGNVKYKVNAVAVTQPSAVDAWGGDWTSWSNANLTTAVDTFEFYYGLEVNSAAAETTETPYSLQDDTKVLADVSGTLLAGGAATISAV